MIFYIILLYFHWYGHFVIDGYFDISFYLKKYLSYLVRHLLASGDSDKMIGWPGPMKLKPVL